MGGKESSAVGGVRSVLSLGLKYKGLSLPGKERRGKEEVTPGRDAGRRGEGGAS